MEQEYQHQYEINIEDIPDLHKVFMPYINHGGIFIQSKKDYKLGDKVSFSLYLPSDPDIYHLEGKVVWITPRGAQGGMSSGIGVQLSEQSDALKTKIENMIVGVTNSDLKTDTL